MKAFLAELKRRRVYRVAIVYAAVAFIIWQAAEIAVPALRLPEWALTLVVLLTIAGFPIALVLAWAFDITPEGVKAAEPGNRAMQMTAGVVLLALVMGAAWLALRHNASTPSPDAKSIAVLPFTNMSADPDNEYFSDGITDDIILHLSKITELEVISRTSVMRYKDTDLNLRQIGEQLGVATILEGGVQRAGDRVRINAQLIDAATDAHLWAESYDRELTDIFAIQSDVAQRIAAALQATLTADERERIKAAPTGNLEAYDLYLRGRFFWSQRGEGIERGLAYFQQALELDPDYARAHAGVADCYNLLGFYAYLRPEEAFPAAKAAALRALEIDERLDEAHASLGFVKLFYEWDAHGAAAEHRRALELNPNSPQAHHWYASTLATLGRFDDAIDHAQRAVEIDPLSVYESVALGWQLIGARRYAEARERLPRAIELNPDFALAHWLLGEAYAYDSRVPESLSHFQRAVELSGRNPWAVSGLGWAYARHGDETRAREILAELLERSNREYVSPYMLAEVHLGLGENDQALDFLEQAFQERNPNLMSLHYYPFWDDLRSEPRFVALIETVGLAAQSQDGQGSEQ
ncbi:MAG: tetratricopeptide repeat protein [Gemmatimonadetes bacterium]|nr:tetratricopeptide repeat protein [Gemmatimonadota bacterium]NIO32813.1 tetratricopeptide repeat protein [Gemmatimonadota bacterium]